MCTAGLTAIRGAIAPVENGRDEILVAARSLVEEIIKINQLSAQDMVALIFSATPDLTAAYPAEAVRGMGFNNLPMLCLGEMVVKGSLPNCLRALVILNCKLDSPRHIYLGLAESLRPDLVGQ